MREAPEGRGWVRVRRRTPRPSRGKVGADRPGTSGGGGAPPAAWVKLIIHCCEPLVRRQGPGNRFTQLQTPASERQNLNLAPEEKVETPLGQCSCSGERAGACLLCQETWLQQNHVTMGQWATSLLPTPLQMNLNLIYPKVPRPCGGRHRCPCVPLALGAAACSGQVTCPVGWRGSQEKNLFPNCRNTPKETAESSMG